MHKYPGSAYVIAFATTALSTVSQNLFPFQAGSLTRVMIEEIYIGVTSSNPNAVAVKLFRGSTTPLSTAAYATISNLDGWTGASVAGSRCNNPSSDIPSTASAALIDARNFEDGFHYYYHDRGDAILAPNQRLDVVVAPLAVTSVVATMKIRELAANPI